MVALYRVLNCAIQFHTEMVELEL